MDRGIGAMRKARVNPPLKKGDFNETIRAKDRWINKLLDAHDYLYRIACDTVGEDSLPAFVLLASEPPDGADIETLGDKP